jgi:hypothetical protein
MAGVQFRRQDNLQKPPPLRCVLSFVSLFSVRRRFLVPFRESTIQADAELAAGADLVRRHVLLPAIGALIGDERQRDEDDRGRQQARPVIVAGRTLEPIVVRDPLA